MRPQPSIHALLSSAIGELAAYLAAKSEKEAIKGNASIKAKVNRLCDLMRAAPRPLIRDHFSDIASLIKTLDAETALPLIVTMAKVDPISIDHMSQDLLIRERLQHARRVAEISQIFSVRNLKQVSRGIQELKKRVFDVSVNG